MPDFGLTPQGFKRKTYPDILADKEVRAKALFGDDVNLAENSPLGLWIRLHAWEVSKLWELAESVYNAAYKDTAEGVSLYGVGKYIGIQPKQPEKAAAATGFIITGFPGTEVPLGFLVGTQDDITFETLQAVKIGADGTAEVPIRCTVAGEAGNVPANTITEIISPKSGILSVTNTTETSGGKDMEADDEFKIRYDKSLAMGGSSTAAAIEATLLGLPGVKDAIVEENEEAEPLNEIPPKSVAPFVYGGDDYEIAEAIFTVKAGGIQSFGNVIIPITDSKGKTHPIGFSRPANVPVWVNISLTTDSNFPDNGNDLVRTEVIKYIGGMDVDATEYNGLTQGQSVILIKIISVAQIVPGITDMQVTLSADGITFVAANIEIQARHIAITDHTKVVVS